MAAATVQVLFGSAKKGKKAAPAEAPSHAPPAHEYVEPSHDERLHNAAADEHVMAARDFVAGRINSKQYSERKERAARFMRHTPKSKK